MAKLIKKEKLGCKTEILKVEEKVEMSSL